MDRKYFSKDYGGSAPENYERFFVPVIGKPMAVDLIRLAALREGERVLDVACGTGVVARLAVEQVGEQGTVAGVDVNPGMVAVARAIASPDASIAWHVAGAESMPLPDEAFDVVLCQLSLQFMPDKLAALKEMRRVLVEGGRMLLNVPERAGRVFAIFAEEMERHIGPEAAGFVRHVFSVDDTSELRRIASEAGFRDITIDVIDKELHFPPPREFLWQYVHGTPLAGLLAEAGEDECAALERGIVARWKEFEANGGMSDGQPVVTMTGRK